MRLALTTLFVAVAGTSPLGGQARNRRLSSKGGNSDACGCEKVCVPLNDLPTDITMCQNLTASPITYGNPPNSDQIFPGYDQYGTFSCSTVGGEDQLITCQSSLVFVPTGGDPDDANDVVGTLEFITPIVENGANFTSDLIIDGSGLLVSATGSYAYEELSNGELSCSDEELASTIKFIGLCLTPDGFDELFGGDN